MQGMATHERMINEVVAEFNRIYPYLKIDIVAIKEPASFSDFFTKRKTEQRSLQDNLISEMARLFLMENIGLSDVMKASELETLLEERLGLLGQILHKSGNFWLKINHTNEWTLKEQNDRDFPDQLR
jgi:hypothetical protein